MVYRALCVRSTPRAGAHAEGPAHASYCATVSAWRRQLRACDDVESLIAAYFFTSSLKLTIISRRLSNELTVRTPEALPYSARSS